MGARYNPAMESRHIRSEPLTCVLADDHDAVRGAVRAQLDRLDWITVVAEAIDGASAIEVIEATAPDVAIIDVRMPRGTGFDVCARVTKGSAATQVILYSALADPANRELALTSGARAFVSKQHGFGALRSALEAIRDDA